MLIDLTRLKTALGWLPDGGGSGAVDSVNGLTGTVILDSDNIDYTTTGETLTATIDELIILAQGGNPNNDVAFFGSGQTTDNTSQLIVTFSTEADTCGEFSAVLTGKRSVGGDAIFARLKVGNYLNQAGTITLIDDTTIGTSRDPFVGGLGMIVAANAGNIEIYANGNSGQTWDWTCYGSRGGR